MVDFLTSAIRHNKDAKILEENGCDENAGQLYGFVAECGLKAIFIKVGGYPITATGDPKGGARTTPHLRKHVNEIVQIVTEIDTNFCGRKTSKYIAKLHNILAFSDWSVDHRYFSSAEIPPSLANWKRASNEVLGMLQEAQLDGEL